MIEHKFMVIVNNIIYVKDIIFCTVCNVSISTIRDREGFEVHKQDSIESM